MNEKLPDECCAKCVFALPLRDAAANGPTPDLAALKNDALICRRFPPSVQIVSTPQGPALMALRPNVMPNDWCGEFADEIEVE